LNNLNYLLDKWRQGLKTPFSPDPANLITLGDQIVLADRIISALQAENENLREIIKEDSETMELWLTKYDISYDCGWRDAIDELIIDTAIEDDIAMRFFNALNDAGIKYRLSPEGYIDYLDEAEKAKGDEIARRVEAEAAAAAGENIQRCRVCGCTNLNACPGGCYWIKEDLCSVCAGRNNQ
jgi:hypothetical protein